MTDTSFKIRIEPSGHEFHVSADETILTAAMRQGLPLAYSCRNGACGTCKGTVISGQVDYGHYQETALTAAERQQGKALFCQAKPRSDLVIRAKEVGAAKDIPIRTLPCRVVAMQRAAEDVMILSLKLPDHQRLQYLAGQYLDILLSGGERRSFSIGTSPLSDELLQLHIRHVPGGRFTDHVFDQMKETDLLRFQGPLGTFFLREDSTRPAILIAGGTGFAPIKAILEYAFARKLARPMHFYWGVRAKRDLYLSALPEQWAATHSNFNFTPVLSEPHDQDRWQGRTGWVHEAVVADHPDLSQFEVYARGPPPMIEAGKKSFAACGLPEDWLFYDSFEFAHQS